MAAKRKTKKVTLGTWKKGKWIGGKRWHLYKYDKSTWVLERYKGDELTESFNIDVEKLQNQETGDGKRWYITYSANEGSGHRISENVQSKVFDVMQMDNPKLDFGDDVYEYQVAHNEYSEDFGYAKGGSVKKKDPAHAKERKYTSQQGHEQAYKGKRKSKVVGYKAEGGEIKVGNIYKNKLGDFSDVEIEVLEITDRGYKVNKTYAKSHKGKKTDKRTSKKDFITKSDFQNEYASVYAEGGEIENASDLYDKHFEKFPYATELIAHYIFGVNEDNDVHNAIIGKYGRPVNAVPYSELMLEYEYTWSDNLEELNERAEELFNSESIETGMFAKGGKLDPAHAKERKYTSQQGHEQSYKGKRKSKVVSYKAEGGEIDYMSRPKGYWGEVMEWQDREYENQVKLKANTECSDLAEEEKEIAKNINHFITKHREWSEALESASVSQSGDSAIITLGDKEIKVAVDFKSKIRAGDWIIQSGKDHLERVTIDREKSMIKPHSDLLLPRDTKYGKVIFNELQDTYAEGGEIKIQEHDLRAKLEDLGHGWSSEDEFVEKANGEGWYQLKGNTWVNRHVGFGEKQYAKGGSVKESKYFTGALSFLNY